MYTIVLGCVLGIAIALSILFPFISQTKASIAQSQKTSRAQMPPYITLEGIITSYDPQTRELIVLVRAPYDRTTRLSLSILLPQNIPIAHSKETYGKEGLSVVYAAEDMRVDESSLLTGQPILLSLHRKEGAFSAAYVRTFTSIL